VIAVFSAVGFSERSFGQYISSNANLNTTMAHLKFVLLDSLDTGILYCNFNFDQTAQSNNPVITSKKGRRRGRLLLLFGAVSDGVGDSRGGNGIRCAGYWA
jgi:hypothetical protein